MEKKRRARINHCLNELKTLILEAMKKDVSVRIYLYSAHTPPTTFAKYLPINLHSCPTCHRHRGRATVTSLV